MRRPRLRRIETDLVTGTDVPDLFRGFFLFTFRDGIAMQPGPDDSDPSPPRAGRLWRILVYVLMLAIACGAIWWIDRGVAMTNSAGK
jgi:hypothetical protein